MTRVYFPLYKCYLMQDWCKPWNSSSLNHCLPWSDQLSQVGWLGRWSDMPWSPGCSNPPFPSPFNVSQPRTSLSHLMEMWFGGNLCFPWGVFGAKQGINGGVNKLHRFLCPPRRSSLQTRVPETGMLLEPAGPPLPRDGKHWTNCDGMGRNNVWLCQTLQFWFLEWF